MTARPAAARGFSLVEMAVVLVILGLLLSGLLTTLTAQQSARRAMEAERLALQAREALLGFAAVNGRLPCPAAPNVASGAANAGFERPPTAAGCTGGVQGVLPWATLGLPELDAWGRRFTYRVTPTFARTVIVRPASQYGCAAPPPTAPVRAAFALCSPGDIEVRVSSGGVATATAVPVVLVMHGENARGSWNSASAQSPVGPDPDEQENADIDLIFVDKTPTDTFDDRVDWIPPPVLMNRMVQTGRLP